MKLEELLKDSPDVLKAVMDAIAKVNEGEADKLKHVRFADLSEGGYVSKDKYTSLETDLSGKTSELEKANGLIEELKKSTGKDEGLQQKITDYEAEIEKLKKQVSELTATVEKAEQTCKSTEERYKHDMEVAVKVAVADTKEQYQAKIEEMQKEHAKQIADLLAQSRPVTKRAEAKK